MPKSNISANLEHDDSIENDVDQFAGADAREEFDLTNVDRGDTIEEVIKPVLEAEPDLEPEAEAEAEADLEAEAKPEAEAEAEADPDPDPVLEPEPKADEKAHMVPKSRMDEEIARRRQLEDRLAKLEEDAKPKQEPIPEFDFDAKEAEYMDAVLDGETDKAKAVRKEIRTEERRSMAAELRDDIRGTTDITKQQLDLDGAVADMIKAYPALDSDSVEADQALISSANELMNMFSEKGMPQAEALRKAVRMTLASDRPELLQAKKPPEKTPIKKRVTDVEGKLEAASKQPAKLVGESAANRGEHIVDISTMTDKDFEKLSDAQMARLRGDFG